MACVVAFLMLTWRTGYQMLELQRSKMRQREDEFVDWVLENPPLRLPGAAAIFTAGSSGIPLALTHHLRHNRVLRERVLLVSTVSSDAPRVEPDQRVKLAPVGAGITRVTLHFGFMEHPNVMEGLKLACRDPDLRAIDAVAILHAERLAQPARDVRRSRWPPASRLKCGPAMPPDSAHRSSGGSQPSLDLARQPIGGAKDFRRRVLGAFRSSLTAGFSRSGHPCRGRGTGRPPLSRLSRSLSDWQHRSRHHSVRWRVAHRSEGCPTGPVAVSRPCHYRRDRHGRDRRSDGGAAFLHLLGPRIANRC